MPTTKILTLWPKQLLCKKPIHKLCHRLASYNPITSEPPSPHLQHGLFSKRMHNKIGPIPWAIWRCCKERAEIITSYLIATTSPLADSQYGSLQQRASIPRVLNSVWDAEYQDFNSCIDIAISGSGKLWPTYNTCIAHVWILLYYFQSKHIIVLIIPAPAALNATSKLRKKTKSQMKYLCMRSNSRWESFRIFHNLHSSSRIVDSMDLSCNSHIHRHTYQRSPVYPCKKPSVAVLMLAPSTDCQLGCC